MRFVVLCHGCDRIKEVSLQDTGEVESATAEANLFALVSHQYWGVWAFLQVRS